MSQFCVTNKELSSWTIVSSTALQLDAYMINDNAVSELIFLHIFILTSLSSHWSCIFWVLWIDNFYCRFELSYLWRSVSKLSDIAIGNPYICYYTSTFHYNTNYTIQNSIEKNHCMWMNTATLETSCCRCCWYSSALMVVLQSVMPFRV